VTTGIVLPFIDRLGRRWLLIIGAAICGVLHFTSGAVMAVHGYPVESVDGKFVGMFYIPVADTVSRQRNSQVGYPRQAC
jgi:membrane protease YdiL (CAAX protease family)